MICQICEKRGHIAPQCYARFNREFKNQGSVNLICEEEDSSLWYPGSGASTHIIVDLGNISIVSPFIGSESITAANDLGLHISHIGYFSFIKENRTMHI